MSTTSVSSEKLSGNVARLVDRLSKDLTTTTAKSEVQLRRGPMNSNSIPKTALVRYSYQAQQEDELCLAEGDLVEVIEEVEDGWMRGKLNDRIGLFPTNFVKFNHGLPNNNAATTYPSSTLSKINERVNDENITGELNVTEKNDKPVNVLPSVYKANRRIMSTIVTSNDAAQAAHVTSAEISKPKVIIHQDKSIRVGFGKIPNIIVFNNLPEYAKVLYEYTASHPDELSLPEGAIITVLNKKCEDDGWFEGELNGKRGLFPENFVKLLPLNESKTSPPLAVPPVLPLKPKPAIGQHMSASGPVPSAENERKSMVAGLQSKLFPDGFPGKPPAAKQPSSFSAGGEVPLQRSIEKTPSEAEADKLSCPTKSRPKQANKRPPSNIRQSNIITKNEHEDKNNHVTLFPAKEAVHTKETKFDSTSQANTSVAPIVTKIEPTSTSKPILVPSNVQKSKNVPLSQATTTVAPTYSTITNSGTNISSNESEFVSRADYNALLQKVDRLEKTVEELQKKLLK